MIKQCLVFIAMLMSSILFPQNTTNSRNSQMITVSGVVTDDQGETIPGATVTVVGSSQGTLTNLQGQYSITVKEGSRIQFSFVGLENKVVNVNKRNTINVVLKTTELLEEVLVVAYGTVDKKDLTGSVSMISGKELASRPVVSVGEAMQGTTPGLLIGATTGQPGAGAQIQLRGVGSMNAGTQPLIVINGVPVLSGNVTGEGGNFNSDVLSTINPSDVENITILKDASATALYGSRGSNGVIMITTKSGKKGESTIQASAEYGIATFATPIELASKEETRNYYKTSLRNYYLENPSLGYTTVEAVDNYINGSQIDQQKNIRMADLIKEVDGNGDFFEEIFQPAKTDRENVSITKGGEFGSIYASLGHMNQEGVTVGSKYERLTGNLNVNLNVTEKLIVDMNTSLTFSEQAGFVDRGWSTNPMLALYGYTNPFIPVYSNDGSYNTDGWTDYQLWGGKYNNIVRDYLDEWVTYMGKTNRLINNLGVSYKILKNLTFKTNLGADITQNRINEYGSPLYGGSAPTNGEIRANERREYAITWSNTLNYLYQKEEHKMTLLVGTETYQRGYENLTAAATEFPNEFVTVLDAAAEKTGAGGSVDAESILSYFGRVDYNYDSKYYASSSFRRDGSSRLPDAGRWANFFSVSSAWRISKEEFFAVDWINDLKFKASFGSNGVLPSGYHPALGAFSYNHVYSGQTGSQYSRINNPNLTWEKTYKTNIGVQGAFLNNRLSAEASYFFEKTTDLIQNVPSSRTIGFNTYTANVGAMQNWGIEASVNYQIIESKDFSWNASLLYDFYRNEVLSLFNGESFTHTAYFIAKEGQPYFTYNLKEWAGVDPRTGAPLWYKNKENEDGTIDRSLTSQYAEAELTDQGDNIPDFNLTLSSTLNYKGWSLSFSFYGRFGGQIFDGASSLFQQDGPRYAGYITSSSLSHWEQNGDYAKNPKPIFFNSRQSTYASTRYLYSATYVRLKNISLSYNLPKKMSDFLRLKNIKLYVNATNFLTFGGPKDMDPEVNKNLVRDSYRVPVTKTIVGGINIDF